MNILHIDSSPRGGASHSRRMSAELVRALTEAHTEAHTEATITYRDLGHEPPPHLTEDWQHGAYLPESERTPEQKEALSYSDEVIEELLRADTVVIGAPMYNFSITTMLKGWLDQVIRINKTFTADYKGLAAGKRVFVVTSRGGGGYGSGEAMEKINFQDPYLRTVFSFIGITDFNLIHINNTAKGDEAVREAVAGARALIHTATLSYVTV